MPKEAVSVTLERDNLVWLRARALAAGVRSVSELLDRIVAAARTSDPGQPGRSVVGTIDVDPDDPWLEQADATVRAIFDRSLARPSRVKESSPEYGSAAKRQKRRGRS